MNLKGNWLVSLLVVGLAGTVLYQLWDRHTNPEGHYKPAFATSDPQSRPAVVDRVSDGDTLVLNTGEKIRLCGVDAPERVQPLGDRARIKLESLIRAAGNQVIVWDVEKDRYGRTVAEVFTSSSTPEHEWETFINSEMVQSGMAYLYPKYVGSCPNKDVIADAEGIAKSSKVGVWAGNYQVPWEFRQSQRN